MKPYHFTFSILITCIWLALAIEQSSAGVLDPQSVQAATLSNGLRLVVSEDAVSSTVSVEVVVRVGSADESPDQAGIAHLLEHVCWAGKSGQDPRAAIEELGGVANAGTLRDFTRFYATVPSADGKVALQSLASMILPGPFQDTVITRERATILAEVAARAEQPRLILNNLAFAELYQDKHAYGRPIEGSEHTLATIDSSKLTLFHHIWYVPNNMTIIIAGNIKFDDGMRQVQSLFGGMQPGALPKSKRSEIKRPAEGHERSIEIPGEDAYLMAAFVGPEIKEPQQVCATDILATLLGQGPIARLVNRLQEKERIAKGVGVDFLTQRDRALFGVWAVCAPDKVPVVKDILRAELSRAAEEPIPTQELATAKRLVAAGYAFANETAADRAATLGFFEGIESYRWATQYLSRVRSVTTEDIAKVASWYAGEPVWIVLMPKGIQK